MNLIVCEKYSFAYCPIPKNACTSIKYWISALENQAPLNPKDVHKEKVVAHTSFASFKSQAGSQDIVKFVVLRNPYDRLVSAFLDKFVNARRRDPHAWAASYWGELARNIDSSGDFSFAQFIDFVDPKSKNPFKSDRHWSSQVAYCGDIDYDIYVNFATLQADMERVFQKCKIPTRWRRLLPLNFHQPTLPKTPGRILPLYALTNRDLCTSTQILPHRFFSQKLATAVTAKYADDFLLYDVKCTNCLTSFK